jgi:alkylhydroperoxidase family enzyme
VIVCATVATLGDSYCSLAWGTRLARSAGAATAAALLQGADAEELTARERTLADWARKVARDPNATTRADIFELHASGLSDLEIFEATALVAFRHAFSMINDALGVQPDWQVADAAPPQVREAITRGRPVAQRIEAAEQALAR